MDQMLQLHCRYRNQFLYFWSMQETKDKAGNKLEDKKNKAKESYDDTQNTIADKISTNPAEEAKAHGQIPADTASLSKKE